MRSDEVLSRNFNFVCIKNILGLDLKLSETSGLSTDKISKYLVTRFSYLIEALQSIFFRNILTDLDSLFLQDCRISFELLEPQLKLLRNLN